MEGPTDGISTANLLADGLIPQRRGQTWRCRASAAVVRTELNAPLNPYKVSLMKQLLRIICALPLLLSETTALADVFIIPASADSIVNANAPDAVSNNTADLVATKIGNSGEVSSDLRIFYAQFQLPGGLTGQDIRSVNDAQLELTRTIAANFRLNYY